MFNFENKFFGNQAASGQEALWECYSCSFVIGGSVLPDECPKCHSSVTLWLDYPECQNQELPLKSQLDASEAMPSNYKISLENNLVRVVDMHLEPGQQGPMHHHKNYLVIQLTQFKALSTDECGKASEIYGTPGNVVWVDELTHKEKNLGRTQQRAIIVEIKGLSSSHLFCS
jgi:redox-sensitive bicupin YhaK (pirin superfamily)